MRIQKCYEAPLEYFSVSAPATTPAALFLSSGCPAGYYGVRYALGAYGGDTGTHDATAAAAGGKARFRLASSAVGTHDDGAV